MNDAMGPYLSDAGVIYRRKLEIFELTVWYLDRANQVQMATQTIGGEALEVLPPEADKMMREGFNILRDDRLIFVPPHRIVWIEWTRA